MFHLGKGLALLLLPAFFVSGLAQKATSMPFSLPVKLKWKENIKIHKLNVYGRADDKTHTHISGHENRVL